MVLSSSGLVWRSKLSVFEFEHELRAQFARFATAMAPAEKGFVDASLEELNEELSSMRMQFDRWAEAREQGVLDIKANHDEKFQEVKGKLSKMKGDEKKYKKLGIELMERLEREKAEEYRAQHEIHLLKQQEYAIPQRVEELRTIIERDLQIANKAGEEMAKSSSTAYKKLEALRHAVEVYRERLGLAFETTPGSENLKVSMKYIDPQDPAKWFTFAVHVGSDGKYSIVNCEPWVGEVDALLIELNRTNSFCNFVRSMRKKFKETIQ